MGCSEFNSDKASLARLLSSGLAILVSGIFLDLFEGNIATPLFEICPL